jgi:DNA-binding beta-propeller fold protein YncE
LDFRGRRQQARRGGASLVAVLVLLVVGCGRSAQKSGVSGGAGASGFPGEVRSWGGLGREAGRFVKPRGIAAGGDRLYVVDMSGRIQVFDLAGHWQATWVLPEVSRGYPTGLGVRQDGCLGVADTHNFVVRLYSPEGVLLQTIGREGGGPGEFTYVRDVAFDGAGTMYVSEHGREDRIQKFDRDGRFLLTWGRSGEGPGEFHRPEGLAIDGEGSLYVADAANHRIQKFSPEGTLLAIWGGPGKGPGELLYPYGLAVGPGGLLLVAEYGNNRVQAFDAGGRSVAVWGGPGREPGEFSQPWGIEWVSGRGLYVVDVGNHRVQQFAAEGVERLAGGTQRPIASSGHRELPLSE